MPSIFQRQAVDAFGVRAFFKVWVGSVYVECLA